MSQGRGGHVNALHVRDWFPYDYFSEVHYKQVRL